LGAEFVSDQGLHDGSLAFEREKWEAEQRRLDREFSLRERELTFKQEEARRSWWWNPLAIAILGAAMAALGSAYVSWQNNNANLGLETFKAESARVFEVVKTGDPNKAAENLSFLLDTGLIQNSATSTSISNYLKGRKAGEGVSLPVPDAQAPRAKCQRAVEGMCLKFFRNPANGFYELPAGGERVNCRECLDFFE
jgi:hypothetical protein